MNSFNKIEAVQHSLDFKACVLNAINPYYYTGSSEPEVEPVRRLRRCLQYGPQGLGLSVVPRADEVPHAMRPSVSVIDALSTSKTSMTLVHADQSNKLKCVLTYTIFYSCFETIVSSQCHLTTLFTGNIMYLVHVFVCLLVSLFL